VIQAYLLPAIATIDLTHYLTLMEDATLQ